LSEPFWGIWCRDGELHREFGEKIITFVRNNAEVNCTDHNTLLQTAYRRDMMEYSCDVMSIKRVGMKYRVTQRCEIEGDTTQDVDIIWIERKFLKIQPISTKVY
jgi:hypothetical protein